MVFVRKLVYHCSGKGSAHEYGMIGKWKDKTYYSKLSYVEQTGVKCELILSKERALEHESFLPPFTKDHSSKNESVP